MAASCFVLSQNGTCVCMCASEALVAKESLAQGCGCCKGTADGKSDLAVSNASCMAVVQDRVPIPEVASGKWLESFVNAWQETAVEIERAQKFLQ